mgnify:CR=1 FL=1|tara:strand:- start:1327 stop:1737 length:411 start_codon:yes stop_codon:yes gene_type:complete
MIFQENKIQLIKKYLPIFFILFLITVYAVWNKPHKNFSSTKPNITIDSSNFINEFKTNSTLATEKYLNQIILVNGYVTDKLTKSVILDNGIVCTLDSSSFKALGLIQINNEISIKGRFVGFDDLFEEIRLDHCFIM